MSDASSVDLSIIIVSWNVADILAECLDSIYSAHHMHRLEVIIVDSASTDHTLDMLHERYSQVIVLQQTENVGYTRGNNIGLEAAKGRFVLLLNPDTVILGDALANMLHYMSTNPDVGILGPYTLNTDGTTQSTRRRFPTVALGFFESTWLQSFAPKAWLDRFYVNDLPLQATVDVDWVQGSALMARREIYEQIGGLDAGYIMFSEELDWCKRAKLAGWRVVFYCKAQIIHHGGKSTEQVTARKHIYFQESKLRYYRKYHGRRVATLLRLFLLSNYLWQIGLETLKSLLGSQRPMRQERIRTYWEVIRSGLKVT